MPSDTYTEDRTAITRCRPNQSKSFHTVEQCQYNPSYGSIHTIQRYLSWPVYSLFSLVKCSCRIGAFIYQCTPPARILIPYIYEYERTRFWEHGHFLCWSLWPLLPPMLDSLASLLFSGLGWETGDTGFSTDMTIKCLTANIGKLSQHPAVKSRAKGCSLVALEVGLWKFP